MAQDEARRRAERQRLMQAMLAQQATPASSQPAAAPGTSPDGPFGGRGILGARESMAQAAEEDTYRGDLHTRGFDEAAYRAERTERSDPNYWLNELKRQAGEDPQALNRILSSGSRQGMSLEERAAELAGVNKKELEAYNARQKSKDKARTTALSIYAAAALAGAAYGAAGAGAGGGGAAAGGGASTAGTAGGVAGAGKGAIAAGAAGQTAGAGGALGAAGGTAATGGGLSMATVPTIAGGTTATGIAIPAAAGGTVAAPGAAAIGAGGAAGTTIGAGGAGAGLGTYGKWANTALQGYQSYASAKEQQKLAKAAAKGTTTTRTPYGNEYISRLISYLLQEQQRAYANRMRIYGASAGNFSPFAALLAQVPSNYSGVGR